MNNQKGFANIISIMVVVILLGAVGYFAFVKKSEPIAQQPTPTPVQTRKPVSPTPTLTPNPTANWKTYTNTQYGFSLTLTDAWKGYKVFQRSDIVYSDVQYLDFGVPTKNNPSGMFHDSGSNGYSAPFGVAVYPKARWSTVSQQGGPIPTYITQNSQYVFAYYGWQDCPNDLCNVNFEIPQILSTFKFTN